MQTMDLIASRLGEDFIKRAEQAGWAVLILGEAGAAPGGERMMTRQEIDREFGDGSGKLASRLTRLAMRKEGPRFRKLGHRTVLYRQTDVRAWLNAENSAEVAA